MAMFPVLKLALDAEVYYGPNRGYATTITGLRRHRVGRGAPGSWEKNWARNHPVQGSAAAAFKLAGIRLDKLYPAYNAKLIIPMHDAYVFEAPVDQLQAVGKLTERVLCEAVQELFPVLRPRAEINNKHPECWNKEGQADALQQWLTSVDRDGSNGTSYHSEQEVQPTGD
jgi:DNA polymerase-1